MTLITWKYCAWISFVNIFLNCRLKVPVTYFDVESKVDWRKHSKRFSKIRRKKIGTRLRKADRNRNPCTFANLLLKAVRNTCKMYKKIRHQLNSKYRSCFPYNQHQFQLIKKRQKLIPKTSKPKISFLQKKKYNGKWRSLIFSNQTYVIKTNNNFLITRQRS